MLTILVPQKQENDFMFDWKRDKMMNKKGIQRVHPFYTLFIWYLLRSFSNRYQLGKMIHFFFSHPLKKDRKVADK